MKLKKVPNMFYSRVLDDRIVTIDEETRKLLTYNNRQRKIIYNVQRVEGGKHSMFWSDYTVEGTINDIEERLTSQHNALHVLYAQIVRYHASKNDPERAMWGRLVEFAKAHESEIFDEYGDFRENLLVTPDEIKSALTGA